jgi:hypothetical protein
MMLKILGKRPVISAPVPNHQHCHRKKTRSEQAILTERYRIAPDIDSNNRKREPKSSKEATSPCSRSPESIQDGIEKIPLVPVSLSELPLHSCSGTDAEEEDQRLAGEDGGCLAPPGVFWSFGVAGEVRLL